jgi:hypothetical protein
MTIGSPYTVRMVPFQTVGSAPALHPGDCRWSMSFAHCLGSAKSPDNSIWLLCSRETDVRWRKGSSAFYLSSTYVLTVTNKTQCRRHSDRIGHITTKTT